MGIENKIAITEMGIISSEVYKNGYFNDNREKIYIGNSSYTVIDYTHDTPDDNGFFTPNPDGSSYHGMDALLLQQNDSLGNPTGEYVIAFRGTELGTLDVGVDKIIGLSNYNSQFGDAFSFVWDMMSTHGISADNLTLTGHSLGGILTQSVGSTLKIKGYAFNPYGAERLVTMWKSYTNTLAEALLSVGLFQVLDEFGLLNSHNSEFAKENIVNISYNDFGDDYGGWNGDPLSNLATTLTSEHLGAYLPIFGNDVDPSEGHKISVLNTAISYYNSVLIPICIQDDILV